MKRLVGEPVEGDLQVAWATQRRVLPVWRRVFEQTRVARRRASSLSAMGASMRASGAPTQ
jgi:hypothetical protein